MSETPLFFRIARPTYGRWLRRKFRISTEGYEKIPQTGPLLLLANHAHTLDPFLISATFNRNVRWVAGAHLFKFYLLRKLLESWVKSISKQQGRSDLDTIKSISKAFKEGGVVGLFPEGTRTWDGEPMGFDISTAKLVRLFKVPVLILNLEGAYGLKPRWVKKGRKGSMVVSVKRVITPEEIANMKLKEIDEALQEELGFSFNRWQAEAQIPYKYGRKAEGVEKLLYLCPACYQSSTIKSKGNKIFCNECGLTFKMDLYDNLICETEGFKKVDSLPAWHKWENMGFVGGSSVGLTMAAIGFFIGSFGGIILINQGIRRGWIGKDYLENLEKKSVRTGFFSRIESERPIGSYLSTDGESIDTFSYHIALVMFVYLLSWGVLTLLSKLLYLLGPLGVDLADSLWGINFIFSAFCAIAVKKFMGLVKVDTTVDNGTCNRINGLAVDLTVASSLGAINLVVVRGYWLPILLLSLVGIFITMVLLPFDREGKLFREEEKTTLKP